MVDLNYLSRRELLSIVSGSAAGMVLNSRAFASAPMAAEQAHRESGATSSRMGAAVKSPPDIVMIVLDDVGYGDLGCFGSEVNTRNIDGVAREGLRYSNFHVTALCTPTRACLLTGRNAHRVGAGTIAEFGRGEPGYRGWISRQAGTLAELLKPRGFATLAVGKWHLSPLNAANAAGPFDQWPTGRGFDKWYGFQGPLTDHWHPELWENTSAVVSPPEPDYHLSTDLTGQAIRQVRDHVTAAPDRPFFLYLAYGACHWPLHVPGEFVARYRGRYDSGWEAIRQQRFTRQTERKLLPQHAQLAPLNPGVPSWCDLSSRDREFAARTQEVYAGFLEHTDFEIGRLIDFLSTTGRLDNTLLMILSDNGASREGARIGMSDVRRNHYIAPETNAELFTALELLGTDHTFAAYPQGWAQVSNTPLKWYKGNTFGGGIRAPLVMRWPAGGLPTGEERHQYHHAIDIVPTLLEVLGIEAPTSIDGVPQLSMDGTPMVYTFQGGPDSPTEKRQQHYETHGDRAIWALGWKAVSRHQRGSDFETDRWELFHTDQDFSEISDLAAQEPQRLMALKALWQREAAKNSVLPLDDRTTEFFAANVQPQRDEYVFIPGMARIDRLSSPDISARSHRIEATLEVGPNPGNGVLLAFGTSMAGYELLLVDGILTYEYLYSRNERTSIQSRYRVPPGRHTVGLAMELSGDEPEHGATVSLLVDGAQVGAGRVPRLWRLYAASAGLRCGANPGAPISRRYEQPFAVDFGLSSVTMSLRN